MEILRALESSGFSIWVRESGSLWSFPGILLVHTYGMGIMVGLILAVDLSILGLVPALPLAPLQKFFPIVWTAFWLNAITGTILLAAHRAMESITLDRGAGHLKDELMSRYAELIYNGFWFTPEREMLQAAIDKSQEFVTGMVTLKLYKGSVNVIGRQSPYSLYDQDLVTFEEGKVAYDHRDAAGFIRLNALRLRTLAQRHRKIRQKK